MDLKVNKITNFKNNLREHLVYKFHNLKLIKIRKHLIIIKLKKIRIIKTEINKP